MNIILFNFGENKPYFKDCISQVKKYNQKTNVFFIGNDKKYVEDAEFYNLKDLEKSENIKQFNDLDFYSKHENPLWRTSMMRFFYMEEFIRKFNLKNIFHFDNDVLIYDDFNNVLSKISAEEENVFTPTNDFNLTCGLFYAKSYHSIFKLNSLILNKISAETSTLNQKYSSSRSLQEEPFMVNEMTILKIIQDENLGVISLFPTLPENENYERYKMCFDPSSWGQYIGGTPNTGPGWAGNHHKIGKEILNNKYKAYMGADNKPKILDLKSNINYKLFNLHIHSKNLNKFI